MSALHRILAVARYERLLLLRSTRFRVLGAVGVAVPVFVGIVLAVAESRGFQFSSALGIGAFVPFYIYSYLQAILIAFVVGDFRAADERAQVHEVLAARPLSTAELVLGKYLGAVGALGGLSLLVLLLTAAVQAAKISIIDAPFSFENLAWAARTGPRFRETKRRAR